MEDRSQPTKFFEKFKKHFFNHLCIAEKSPEKNEKANEKEKDDDEAEKNEMPTQLQLSELDLVFVMDYTASMGSYINSACSNIQRIFEEIVSKEKADIRLALIKYCVHPPQDTSFITDVHGFTSSIRRMITWLDNCQAAEVETARKLLPMACTPL